MTNFVILSDCRQKGFGMVSFRTSFAIFFEIHLK
jgi:hypothetical protein